MNTDLQKPFDVAVIMPTILRPQLGRAVRSIFAQDFKRRIQIMLGVDKVEGDRKILEELRAECPDHIAITVIDLGYSTAKRNGGLYSSFAGGALRTILSYAANSRHLAYLDDDNWFAPHHLNDLRQAIKDKAWTYSLRWFVDPATLQVLCVDDFISAGPRRGMMRKKLGGFVDTNCLLIDKIQCDAALHLWCEGRKEDGTGEDQLMYAHLSKNFPSESTNRPSVYYVTDLSRYPQIQTVLRQRGCDPSKVQPVPAGQAAAGKADLSGGRAPFSGRIFVIGLPGTGLKPLCTALSFLGYRLSLLRTDTIDDNTLSGQNVFAGLPVARRFREMDQHYPSSKFILTIPPESHPSSTAHGPHEQAVRKYFENRPDDLLLLNISAGEGWDKLCSFLGHHAPQYPFPKAEPAAKPTERGI